MAKKKKRNDEKKRKFEHLEELYGIILILLCILGVGKYGIVGQLMCSFGIFLVGTGYNIFLVILLLIGGYLVVKRKFPNFFTTKMIGIYIMVLGLLVLSHLSYVQANDGEAVIIFQETINNLLKGFHTVLNNHNPVITGGGILGCCFAVLFNFLFDSNGTLIVAWVLIGFGLLMFTGISIFDIVRNALNKGKAILPKKKEKRKENDPHENTKVIIHGNDEEVVPVVEEEKEEKKIVISSIDQLTQISDEPKGVQTVEEKMDQSTEQETLKPNTNNYHLPSMNLLDLPKKTGRNGEQASVEHNIIILEKVLKDFGIIGKVVEVHMGPTVTQYELELQAGTRVNKLLSIGREISLALAKKDVRIEAPIPGKNTVGIEIPNNQTVMVSMREVIEKVPEKKKNNKLLVALGKNIMGENVYAEIDKTPHLLVAGATGSGKSVCINGIITSILMRAKPDEVKLVLVDPKKVELSVYNGAPHLLAPVVTDPKKANVALARIVSEMERRYDVFSENGVRNIATYNEMIEKKNEGKIEAEKEAKMPYIVVIIDELADLMLVAAKEVEDSIMRITQMARAAGIHLIIATQRPSTDVITGVVKANIPSRISFAVSSSIDSRTILDMTGAEKLLGKGDMLFLPMGESAPVRVQGAYISDDEIKRVIDYTAEQQVAQYDENMLNLAVADKNDHSVASREEETEEYDDPLYNEVVEFVVRAGKVSASLLQRKYRLGYNRAARIVDLLEERGIIGPANGSKPREVLVKLENQEPMDEE